MINRSKNIKQKQGFSKREKWMQAVFVFSVFILLSFLPLCAQVTIQNGDFILFTDKSDALSRSIDNVTKQNGVGAYSHIGLIEQEGNVFWLLHAAPQNGSERVLLKDYLKHKKKGQYMAIYRLKDAYQYSIPHAINTAKGLMGKSYNFTYILNDTSYYCSDLLQRSFASDSIFELLPMTFKDPLTGKTDDTWVAYYRQLQIEIPEGSLGCNPNGMAASDKLYYVSAIRKYAQIKNRK